MFILNFKKKLNLKNTEYYSLNEDLYQKIYETTKNQKIK